MFGGGGGGMPINSLLLHLFRPTYKDYTFSAEFLANGMANACGTFPQGIVLLRWANFIKSPSSQKKKKCKKHQNARHT
jgi:hypothetical protein